MNSEIIENVKMNIARGLELFDQEAIRRGIEIWRPIKDYPNYAVSSLGSVKNVKTGRILKLQTDKDGYHNLGLKYNGKLKLFKVHRLVASAFIPNPYSKQCVDHKNGLRTDNNVINLRWATVSENNYNQKLSIKNTSGYKGVSWIKRDQKWCANIRINGKAYNLGYYNTLKEARKARQTKSKAVHGEFQNPCEKS